MLKNEQHTFYLDSINAYAKAEQYKKRHENAGARVTLDMSPTGDKVTIFANYYD